MVMQAERKILMGVVWYVVQVIDEREDPCPVVQAPGQFMEPVRVHGLIIKILQVLGSS